MALRAQGNQKVFTNRKLLILNTAQLIASKSEILAGKSLAFEILQECTIESMMLIVLTYVP